MRAEAHVAEHFGSAHAQRRAATLGMWIFLSTELLLFTGLFVAYAMYRLVYASDFAAAAGREMEVGIGTWNTFILLASSVFVALADVYVKRNRGGLAAACLATAALLGVAFMTLKLTEYSHHAEHHALPGKWYALEGLPQPGAAMFITLYFLMTGLHAIHLSIAIVAVGWIAIQAAAGEYSKAYATPVQLVGLYWHFVDIVWVFLYPLFYLVSVK